MYSGFGVHILNALRVRFQLKKIMRMRVLRQLLQAWAQRALRRCWRRRQAEALRARQQRRRIKYLTGLWRCVVLDAKVSVLWCWDFAACVSRCLRWCDTGSRSATEWRATVLGDGRGMV